MTKPTPLMHAIAAMEGYYRAGSVPQRLNNPGDLMFAKQHGAKPATIKGTDGKSRTYAKWDTEDEGWAALAFQLGLYAKRGLTLIETIQKWAPASDGNDPHGYAAYVAKSLGVTLDTKLSKIMEA